VWSLLRFAFRLFSKLAWWQRLVLVAVTPLLGLNLTVAFVGHSVISPLSPFFLAEKWAALKLYGQHRPSCLLTGHEDLARVTAQAERDAGLPKGLMQAIVEVESDARSHRISYAGAMGPAQLMPGTAALLGVKDPFDPEESIAGGARYLASMLKRTGDVQLAIAAYNAGPNAVNGSIPQNGQTELYVAKVMRKFKPQN
jgi:soluble lytic murein transglycosylase-like protein